MLVLFYFFFCNFRYHDNQLLNDQTESVLNFKNVSPEMNGKYSCVIRINENDEIRTKISTVHVIRGINLLGGELSD